MSTEDLRKKLDEKIPREVIAERDGGGGKKLSYLEGWYVISRLNEVFGQGGWDYQTDELKCVFEGQVQDKFVAHYIAKVCLNVPVLRVGPADGAGPYFSTPSFSDYGYGDGQDRSNPGKAHELAVKEAITDGIKRAAKNLGWSTGLALYDKTKENVQDVEEVKPRTQSNPKPRASIAVKAEARPPVALPSQEAGATSQEIPESKEDAVRLIRVTSKVLVAKKKYSMDEIIGSLKSMYNVDKADALDAESAKKFLGYLYTQLES